MGIRLYELNENVFDNLTPNTAYILGFWWADGSIYEINGKIREFNITQKNETELLLKIRNEFGTDIPLRKHNRSGSDVLKITSCEICNKIIEYGGMPNKSCIIEWPKNIQNELIPHFIRGYFDGDGCIHHKSEGTWVSSFTSGSLIFLQQLQYHLNLLNTNIVGFIIQQKNTYILYLSQKETKCLGYLMYSQLDTENGLYMKRKFDKFICMLDDKGSQLESLSCKLNNSIVNDILNKIECGHFTSITQIQSVYKIHRSTIDQIFSRKSWKQCTNHLSDVELQKLRDKLIGKHNMILPWMKR